MFIGWRGPIRGITYFLHYFQFVQNPSKKKRKENPPFHTNLYSPPSQFPICSGGGERDTAAAAAALRRTRPGGARRGTDTSTTLPLFLSFLTPQPPTPDPRLGSSARPPFHLGGSNPTEGTPLVSPPSPPSQSSGGAAASWGRARRGLPFELGWLDKPFRIFFFWFRARGCGANISSFISLRFGGSDELTCTD